MALKNGFDNNIKMLHIVLLSMARRQVAAEDI